jgi:hypothetical protein
LAAASVRAAVPADKVNSLAAVVQEVFRFSRGSRRSSLAKVRSAPDSRSSRFSLVAAEDNSGAADGSGVHQLSGV